MTIRFATQRPLLIAIGPGAADALETQHSEVELVDVLVADARRSPTDVACLVETGALVRDFTVCLFDTRDEACWPAAVQLVAIAREYATWPLWFICADRRAPIASRLPMLERLASSLRVCVIDPGDEPIEVALAGVAALYRSGLAGIAAEEVAMLASEGRVAVAMRTPLAPVDRIVDGVLLVVHCGPSTSLRAINDICAQVDSVLPDAERLLAAPVELDRPEVPACRALLFLKRL